MRRCAVAVLVVAMTALPVTDVVAVAPVVGVAALPDGSGHWTVDDTGDVRNLGSAPFYGSLAGMPLRQPIVGIAATPAGRGYWLVARDGGIFSFGSATFFGSTGAIRLNQPIVGMASTPSGRGYWLVASDGGIFSFGDARFFGSTGAIKLNQPIVGMAATVSGAGYWMVARDGGIFSFGDAEFAGAGPSVAPGATFAGMATRPAGGYWLVTTSGRIYGFGGAPDVGAASPDVVATSRSGTGVATVHRDARVETHRSNEGAVPVPTPLGSARREAWRWPFSSTSPWNMPIGSLAQYEAASAPATASAISPHASAWINAGKYSHPLYKATSADPRATFRRAGRPDVVINVPLTARPSPGTDAQMHVADPTGRWVDESYKTGGAHPLFTTKYHVRNDLHGPGVGAGGTRAYGGSAIGGLIRSWEVDVGAIRHALALGIQADQLVRGWVWPATNEDGNAETSYSGKTPMGSLFAIPPAVDIGALGLSREGLLLARALQDHGAYVVDRSGCFCLYAEPSLDGSAALVNMRKDLARLRPHLRRVTNNGPTTVGGGGVPRTPLAPPPS